MGLDGIERVIKVRFPNMPNLHLLISSGQKARRESEIRKASPSALEEEDD